MLQRVLRVLGSFTLILLGCSTLSVRVHAQSCGPIGGSNVFYGPQQKHPYTATVHITNERHLYDGNVIRSEATLHESRDSAGRTRSESVIGCDVGDDGRMVPRLQIMVSDSAAKTTESWAESSSSNRTAQLSHWAVPEPLSKEEMAREIARSKAQRAAYPTHTEKLGTRTIAGLLAEGTRTTRTTPPGTIGNVLAITAVEEVWVSREYGVMLLRTSDNPLNSHQSFEVTDIILAEPDASLFSPPANYSISDTELKVVRQAASAQPAGQ